MCDALLWLYHDVISSNSSKNPCLMLSYLTNNTSTNVKLRDVAVVLLLKMLAKPQQVGQTRLTTCDG